MKLSTSFALFSAVIATMVVSPAAAAVRGQSQNNHPEDSASTTTVDIAPQNTDQAGARGRRDRATGQRRVLNNGKGNGKGKGESGRACPTCQEQLPGYAFFGQNYLEEKFWSDVTTKIVNPSARTLPSPGSARFGEDFFVPGPFLFSTDRRTCYDSTGNLVICALITGISEAIYESDLLRCLFMSLTATVRDLTCLDQFVGIDRRQLLADDKRQRKLSGESVALSNQDLILNLPAVANWTTYEDVEKFFGLNVSAGILKSYQTSVSGRKLNPDFRGKGDSVLEFLGVEELFSELGYGDSNIELAVKDNLFFLTCSQINDYDLALCAALFGLLKTLDASVCYSRETLGCGEDTCTKDLAFDVAYNTERLALDLPIAGLTQLESPFGWVANLVVADILSPCSACLIEKSGGCAAFCPLYESFHTCDNVGASIDLLQQVTVDGTPVGQIGGNIINDFLAGLI